MTGVVKSLNHKDVFLAAPAATCQGFFNQLLEEKTSGGNSTRLVLSFRGTMSKKSMVITLSEQDSLRKEIDVLKDIIIELVDPDRIILFGSFAYGIPDENSDADFLVIKNGIEHTIRDEAKLATRIHYLRKERGVRTRCDAFLESEQSALDISRNGGAYVDAFEKGTVIYVR